jgi:hypothetical protein
MPKLRLDNIFVDPRFVSHSTAGTALDSGGGREGELAGGMATDE